MDSARVKVLAAQALAITAQDWTRLGFSDDPQVAPSSNINVIAERIVSLLAIRSVAVLSTLEDFKDFSTTTICRTILLNNNCWPEALTEEVIAELRAYVKRIINGYNEKPYHNREHAYHVLLSSNKLLDIMLNSDIYENGNGNSHERQQQNRVASASKGTAANRSPNQQHQVPSQIPKTFGLRRDTLSQFTLLFAALIHDVQHGGVSNRQLALEDDPLSLVYNDSSVLEQQSLTIAFAEFLQPEFAKLRKVILPSRDVYSGFRKNVVNLVLATDIANPERMQLTKDKWKTAFGDVDQSEARRESAITQITLPKQNNGNKEFRRQSVGSLFSELSLDLDASNDSSDRDLDDDIVGLEASAQSGSSHASSNRVKRGNHFRSQTPDSIGTLSLDDIDESDGSRTPPNLGAKQTDDREGGDIEVNSQDLGYAPQPSKNNGDRPPKPGLTAAPASRPHPVKGLRATGRRGSSVPDGFIELAALRGNSFRLRRGSVAGGDTPMKRMQRRLSAPLSNVMGDTQLGTKYRQRVGLMRTVDLGGETIENFSRKGSMRTACLEDGSNGKHRQNPYPFEEYDEPDDLRATVVMETMLLAADVAHNLQGWDHMLKWSQNLYWELYDANEAGRGFDPSPGWVGGQTGFLQGYMLPLAEKLGNTGVFGDDIGPIFAAVVQHTTDQWEIHGEAVTALVLSKRELDILAIRSRDHLSSADSQSNGHANPK